MLVDVINKSESTLVLEYNNNILRLDGNGTGKIEAPLSELDLSAYYELTDKLDLELNGKSVKNILLQKGFDKLISAGKKLTVHCKITYHIKLNDVSTPLVFEFDAFGKDNSTARDYFDMPIDFTSFARLECDSADIDVVGSRAVNKNDFLKMYRRLYFFINWSAGLDSILLYIPSYVKQKRMTSPKRLTKVFKKFYSDNKNDI